MTLTLLKHAIEEDAPEAIYRRDDNTNTPLFGSMILPGKWLRVFPKNAKDVLFIQLLEHAKDKFAPLHGEGILINPDVL
jgi:hypothetical protein